MAMRENTHVINVGGVKIGGGNKIPVQSMCNTDTRNVKETVNQIKTLEALGCEIIRVAVPDMTAAEAISDIKKQISIPLVCDIHFDYRLALKCAENGADKIRINPGNIGSIENTKLVVNKCKERNIPIRIGVNGGSLEKSLLEKYGSPCAEALCESAMQHVKILEDLDFNDICISLKASDVNTTISCYKRMSELCNYPLHVGVTEAGTTWGGTIKSSVGIGAILALGIGDTIRVSLTGKTEDEVMVGRKILQSLSLGGDRMVEFTSCPTCGRTEVDLIGTANKIETALYKLETEGRFVKPFHAAVMGCAVNGPGEARNADIGIAGGKKEFLLFQNGEIIGKLPQNDVVEKFIIICIEKFGGK